MSISLLFITSIVFSVAGFPSCFSADQRYEKCLSPLRCGSTSSVFPNITYPFWGTDIDKPSYCGRSQFKLSCEDNQFLTLAIRDLTLRVVSANLSDKAITVADESLLDGRCPKILNFSGYDRFTITPNTQKISLYDCTDHHPPINSLSSISCQSNYDDRRITYHVFGPFSPARNCTKAGEIPMRGSAKNDLHQANYSNLIEDGFGTRVRFDIQYRRQSLPGVYHFPWDLWFGLRVGNFPMSV